MTFTGSDKWSVQHSQSNDHNHKQMVSSCWIRPGGCLMLPLPLPRLLQLTTRDCPAHTCRRTGRASLTLKPIRGLYDEALILLSKSQRSLLKSRSYSHILRPLCRQQEGRYGPVVIAPGLPILQNMCYCLLILNFSSINSL